LKYRPEIDGLRAVAVLPVILFHAGFELFKGGFVGVDIFFVISGYLITSILIKDLEADRFSIITFYERRARRILPALFFVMLCFIPFAWIWMLPQQMQDFSQGFVAVALFASNILFWSKSGYFEAAAEENPLLHTWSLAVEEQFYIVFPILLFFVWKLGPRRVFWTFFTLALCSLAFAEWGWRNAPSANFFLAPSRAWELLAGSLAALAVHKNGVQKNEPLALIGLAAIVFSIFAFDHTTPFPSVYALVPVIGVVLVIMFAHSTTLTAKTLSFRVFVGIGLISYSAYLWHQPLFAFARIYALEELTTLVIILLCILTIILAYLSWRFVEQPFRKQDNILSSRKTIFSLSLIATMFFGLLGGIGHIQKGVPQRFGDEFVQRFDHIQDLKSDRKKNIKSGVCQFNQLGKHKKVDAFVENWNCIPSDAEFNPTKSIAVYGDSHAADKAVALMNNGWSVTRLGGANCPLIFDTNNKHPRYCNALIEKFTQHIKGKKYTYIALANRFEGKEVTAANLQEIVDFWAQFDTKIVLFTAMPEYPSFDDLYARSPIHAQNLSYDHELLETFNAEAQKVSMHPNVRFVDTQKIFCALSDGACHPINNDIVFLTDYGHLSRQGADLFGQSLEPTFEQAFAQ
jgi:peptidoglycan/LPS O-acetylase OafA/YrhL